MSTSFFVKQFLATAIVVCLSSSVLGGPLFEVPIGSEYLNVEYVVGSGQNLSLVIVDFEQTGGSSYAFGFRWDSATDFANVLDEVVNSSPMGSSLVAELSSFPGFGTIVDNFSYGTDVGEHDEYWRMEIGNYDGTNISWETAGAGLSWLASLDFTENPTSDPGDLDNGIQPSGTTGIIGFYNSWADSNIKPRVPTAVPEPAGWALMAAVCGFSMVIAWHQRKSEAIR
jgi:hypothetical protein